MPTTHACNRCGFTATGKTDYHAARAFDAHVCRFANGEPMRSLNDLPSDLLYKLATKQITECQAFDMLNRAPEV